MFCFTAYTCLAQKNELFYVFHNYKKTKKQNAPSRAGSKSMNNIRYIQNDVILYKSYAIITVFVKLTL